MTKTAILLPYPAQYDQIIQLAEAFPSLEIICVEHAHTNTVVQMATELQEKGCELIIARGLQAHLLRESITVPIVDMKVTTQELGMVILELKKQVKSPCPKIGLVGYHNMFGDTDRFTELFEVELRKYTDIVNREIEVHVEQAHRDGCDAIIGGDVACGRATELGLPSYKIPAGMESLANALRSASMVSYAIEMSKTNNAEIDVMLNNTFTGIMQVDNDGVIKRMKDTSGDITLTEECVRRNRDVDFKVFGGKDTLLYASMCVGAVGGVCTAGNFMPELIEDIYHKFIDGDMKGALEAQFKLNPVRLAMDLVPFPNAAKDMGNLRGLEAGLNFLPCLPTPEGPAMDAFKKTMTEAGLL